MVIAQDNRFDGIVLQIVVMLSVNRTVKKRIKIKVGPGSGGKHSHRRLPRGIFQPRARLVG
jgi:hypothetical protein